MLRWKVCLNFGLKYSAKLNPAGCSDQQVMEELKDARLLFAKEKANVTRSLEESLERCSEILPAAGNEPDKAIK